MKALLIFIGLFWVVPVLASGADCELKQKNAASFALAQKLGVPVQAIEVLGYEHRNWTDSGSHDTGFDDVTVRYTWPRGATSTRTYSVTATQIERSLDCEIGQLLEQPT